MQITHAPAPNVEGLPESKIIFGAEKEKEGEEEEGFIITFLEYLFFIFRFVVMLFVNYIKLISRSSCLKRQGMVIPQK